MPSIRKTVPFAFLIPLLTCVGILGTIALLNDHRQADNFSQQSMKILDDEIVQRLQEYLEIPHFINEINAGEIAQGQLNLEEPNKLEHDFWHQAKVFKSVNGIRFGYAANGELQSIVRENNKKDELLFHIANGTNRADIVYEADQKGHYGKELSKQSNFDARERVWYKTAVKAGKPTWTEIFEQKTTKQTHLRISAVRPVYEQGSHKLQGVLAVDFFLTQISEFLTKLSRGTSRKIFIVQPSGELISASSNSRVFDDKGKQIQATNFDKEPLIKATAEYVNKEYSGFGKIEEKQQFKFSSPKGEGELVQITPYQDKYGLNWKVVIVVPEKEFMQGFDETRNVTIFVGLGTLLFSLLLGMIVTRWLTNPILQLNDAARQIASDDEVDLHNLASMVKRSDEIGQLARVFQEMADVVHTRQQSLKDRVQQLLSETDKAKKASLAKQIGNVDLQELLMRSRSCREKTTVPAQNLSNLLHKVPSFQNLNSLQLQKLIEIGYQQTLLTDVIIDREDEINNKFYLILTGSVELYIEKLNKPLILSTGEFFGEQSLLESTPEVATARTLEPTTLFIIDQQKWKTLLQHHPELVGQFTKEVVNS